MNGSEVVAWVDLVDDRGVLQLVRKAIDARLSKLSEIAWKARRDEAWTRYRRFKPGISVWCCASGTFLGGPLQRGDRVTVEHVQPRARRLWLRIKGKLWRFGESDATRYELRTVPPKEVTQ